MHVVLLFFPQTSAASNLEQQERLFKNQIKLGLREILQQELNFYNQAFNNISSCASILAGFAFTGLMLDPFDHKNDLQPNWLKVRAFVFVAALSPSLH